MNITLAYDEEGDWMALYVNEQCVFQNHSISPEELLKQIGLTFKSTRIDLSKRELSEFPWFLSELNVLQSTD